MKCPASFPRQACRISPRHDPMSGRSPASSSWNLHVASTCVYAMLVCTLTLTNARSAKRRVWTSLAEQGEHFRICPLSLVSVRSCRIGPTPLVSSTGPMNMQRPPCPGRRRIFSMGSIIARFLESVLLLETEGYPTITSRIIVTSHSASPPMASLHSKCGSIPRRSSSFSTTISLRTNAFKRTTFFVLGSYPVQKSHGMQTPSSIRSCENCLSSRSACLYMMPSRAAYSTSMPMSLLALVTFPPFPCLCT